MSRQRKPARVSPSASADLLLHPLRLRIVQTLLNSPPTSPKAMLDRLPGVAPATLYRHLQLLTAAGITVVAEERAVRGALEKSYALGQAALAPTPDELLRAGPQQQFRYFASFVSTLMDQYGAYLGQEDFDLVRDGVAFRQAAIHATDREYAEFVKALSALIVKASKRPGQGRKRRLLSCILMPAVERDRAPETGAPDASA